jgi:hypothetical protein
MIVASRSAARSTSSSPAYGSPLPPGATASAICGAASRSTSRAIARTMKLLVIEVGAPMTIGTAPSQTPVVCSAAPMVWYEPPEAP